MAPTYRTRWRRCRITAYPCDGSGGGPADPHAINPHIICRETEKEVKAVCCAILEGENRGAVDGLMVTMTRGDQSSWRGHKRDQRIIGGNVHVFGTQEQVTEQLAGLHAAGCDGVQINFFDFAADLNSRRTCNLC